MKKLIFVLAFCSIAAFAQAQAQTPTPSDVNTTVLSHSDWIIGDELAF